MMLKVQLWHKQHLKDQTEEGTSSTRKKFNAVEVPMVGNGQQKEVFWERVIIHYNSNLPFALNPKKRKESLTYRYIVICFKSYFWHISI
jgi:hypothetical protein